jgi:hypothetical protein
LWKLKPKHSPGSESVFKLEKRVLLYLKTDTDSDSDPDPEKYLLTIAESENGSLEGKECQE